VNGLRLIVVILCLTAVFAYSKEYRLAKIPSLSAMFPSVEATVQEAFDLIGHSVSIELYPEARAKAFLISAEVDGELIRETGYDNRISGIVQVPVTLATTNLKLFVHEDANIQTLASMRGKRIAVLRGAPILSDKAKQYGAIIVEIDDFEKGLLMLTTKRLSGLLMPDTLKRSLNNTEPDFLKLGNVKSRSQEQYR